MFAHLYHLLPHQVANLPPYLIEVLLDEADAWYAFQAGEKWEFTGAAVAADDVALLLDPKVEVVDVGAS